MPATDSAAGMTNRSGTVTPGTVLVIMIDPMTRLTVPPMPNTPKLGTFNSRMQQRQTKHDQEHAGRVDWQDLQREKREQQTDAAGDARGDGSRIPEFHGQTEDPQGQKNVGDLRMCDGAQEALPPAHLHSLNDCVGRADRDRPAVEPSHGAAVEFSQQLGDVPGNEIDQRRRGAQGFAIGERAALHHGLGRESDVPLPRFGQGPRERRDVLGRLRRGHGVGGRPAARDRVCRSDVRTRRHHRHIGRDGQDEPRRRRAGAGRTDKDDDRCARRDHARDDVAGRVEQASRRAQDDHDHLGARGLGRGDRLVHVLGGDRVNDGVQLGDDGDGCVR